jgi:hypothetical protein
VLGAILLVGMGRSFLPLLGRVIAVT